NRHDGAPHVARRFGNREPWRSGCGPPVVLGRLVCIEHHLRAKPSGRDRHRCRLMWGQLGALRERAAIHSDLCQLVYHRQPAPRCGVVSGSIGHFDDKTSGAADHKRQEMMRRYQVSIDPKAKDPESLLEIKLPDRFVPVRWSTFETFGTPNVVDQYVDVPMRIPDLTRQALDLAGVEMVNDRRYAGASQRCHKLRSFLDCLRAVVIGLQRTTAAAAAATDDCGP